MENENKTPEPAQTDYVVPANIQAALGRIGISDLENVNPETFAEQLFATEEAHSGEWLKTGRKPIFRK